MNKLEFKRRTNAQKQYTNRAIFLSLIPYGIVLSIGIYLYFISDITIISENKKFFIYCILFILISIGITPFLFAYRNMKRLHLICPFCKKVIIAKHWESTLNTLKCSNCSQKIID